MKKSSGFISMIAMCSVCTSSFAVSDSLQRHDGELYVGTRNTISAFNDDDAIGIGIGGQFRLRFSERINSEWFLDYITSQGEGPVQRKDYHIGWSLLVYPSSVNRSQRIITPYLVVGHCFDLSKLSARNDQDISASRFSMATQAGIGAHFHILPQLDCSLTGQYMLHFGKQLHVHEEQAVFEIEKHSSSSVHGHLLFSLSFNYCIADLW